jgi:SAM-dependent methyltransferase
MSVSTIKKHRGGSDPKGFDTIVREVFAPIYPVIAEQIVARTGVTAGRCLDAGCGTGALGRALALIGAYEVTFFDQSDAMLDYAKVYARKDGILKRSDFLQGDIHDIPLESGCMDLVISRGSSPFWEDWGRAYAEILRVLRRGGMAYIGGGFGNAQLRESIVSVMRERNPDWDRRFKNRFKGERESLPGLLNDLAPAAFEIIDDERGHWAVITK